MGVTYASKPKQSWEEIPDSVDFVDRLPAGATLSSCGVKGYDAAGVEVTTDIVKNATVATTKSYFTYFGGTDGNTYKVSHKGVGSNGAKLEEDFFFTVKDY